MSDMSVIGNAMVGSVRSTTPQTKAPAVEVTNTEDASTQEVVRTDQVEFSEQAKWLEKIHQLPEVRQDQIDSLKEAIASNTYLSDDKLQIAFDRLIEEVQQ